MLVYDACHYQSRIRREEEGEEEGEGEEGEEEGAEDVGGEGGEGIEENYTVGGEG